MLMSLALVAVVAISGTLAYFSDRNVTPNVFTWGDVEITLNESFEQGVELIPGVDIEKIPTITNTGKTDAWVWLTFSIPSALDNWNPTGGESGSNNNVIHWNPLGVTTEGYGDNDNWVTNDKIQKAITNGYLPEGTTAADIKTNNTTWDVFNELVAGGNAYQEMIADVQYNTYVLPYNKALTPGETTLPNITKVFLDAQVDIDPEGNLYKVVNGTVTPITWNVNTNGNPIIYVAAYGIQKDNNIADVDAAYAAFKSQWGDTANANTNAAVVATPSNGAVRPAGYAPKADGETIDGLTVVDRSDDETNLRALYKNGMTGDLTVNNSVLDGTYAMNVTAAKTATVKLSATNTTFMGWVSYSGWETATFTDCTFRLNSEGTYNVIRPYDPTTFTNCEFKGTELWLDKLDGAKITLVNCTYNGKLITDASVFTIPYGSAADSMIINNTNN